MMIAKQPGAYRDGVLGDSAWNLLPGFHAFGAGDAFYKWLAKEYPRVDVRYLVRPISSPKVLVPVVAVLRVPDTINVPAAYTDVVGAQIFESDYSSILNEDDFNRMRLKDTSGRNKAILVGAVALAAVAAFYFFRKK